MNDHFPRILTLLRKERGISQKKAAAELGISQALLSHYEKGIRECGLDFLTRTADYYGVSCDYLLGRTPDRTGAMLTVEDLPDADPHSTDQVFKGSILATLNKKLVANSLNVVFDLMQRSGSKQLTNELSAYLMLAVYQAFRVLYAANPHNPQGVFGVHARLAGGLANAAMEVARANAGCIAGGENAGPLVKLADPEALALSSETLKERYPYFQQSLFNLIQRAEGHIEARLSKAQ